MLRDFSIGSASLEIGRGTYLIAAKQPKCKRRNKAFRWLQIWQSGISRMHAICEPIKNDFGLSA